MPERLPAADEIVRHTEIKTFRRGHLQRETAFAPALKLLRAGQQVSMGRPSARSFWRAVGASGFSRMSGVNQTQIVGAAFAGDGAVTFQFPGQNPVYGRHTLAPE
jgi:hypothetical protein